MSAPDKSLFTEKEYRQILCESAAYIASGYVAKASGWPQPDDVTKHSTEIAVKICEACGITYK